VHECYAELLVCEDISTSVCGLKLLVYEALSCGQWQELASVHEGYAEYNTAKTLLAYLVQILK
jgi:hypothetical protein